MKCEVAKSPNSQTHSHILNSFEIGASEHSISLDSNNINIIFDLNRSNKFAKTVKTSNLITKIRGFGGIRIGIREGIM